MKINGDLLIGDTNKALKNIPFEVGQYAALYYGNQYTFTITAWAQTVVPFSGNTSGTNYVYNGYNSFERDGNYIKCKFDGSVLILRYFAMNETSELDLIDTFGWETNTGARQASGIEVRPVSNGTNISLTFASGYGGEITSYGARLIVIRLT